MRLEALQQLGAHYKKNPGDRTTIIYYSAALRANGQNEQAIAVLEAGLRSRNDAVRSACIDAMSARSAA